MTTTRFIPVPQWNDFYPWPSPSGLRWMIFNAEKNGFADAFPKINGRRLVDEEKFFEIARAQGNKESSQDRSPA